MTESKAQKMYNMGTAPYYQIIHAAGADYFLAKKVNFMIEDGWSPLGGPFSHEGVIKQAMIYVDTSDIINTFERVQKT